MRRPRMNALITSPNLKAFIFFATTTGLPFFRTNEDNPRESILFCKSITTSQSAKEVSTFFRSLRVAPDLSSKKIVFGQEVLRRLIEGFRPTQITVIV